MDTHDRCPDTPKPAVSSDIRRYVEHEILPLYASFDKAHRQDHALMVISQSLALATHFPDINPDMVYLVAAFHDLGLAHGRENHHHYSRTILEADPFILSRFTAPQITLMGEAVEDHRASGTHRPRNNYGLIVAEADRNIDIDLILRRTIQYGLAHYPTLDRQQHYLRTVKHLTDKYGPDGYLRIWLPWSDNAAKLRHLHALLSDEQALYARFNGIFDEENQD